MGKKTKKAINKGCDVTESILELFGDVVFSAFEHACKNCHQIPRKKGKHYYCPKCGRRIK